jgi:hypothetical protein
MSPDLDELARFAHVEPPAQLDAWVRARLRAAVAERAADGASGAVAPRSALAAPSEPCHGVSREPSRAAASRTMPARTPVAVPLVERVALAVGAVACGVQASGLVIRVLWSVLTLGR